VTGSPNARNDVRIAVAREWMLAAAGLLAVTFFVYAPALHGDFLWDDDSHIQANPSLRSLDGLRHIWLNLTPTADTSFTQYYPLTESVWWLWYHLFGLKPIAFHLLNVALHATNAVLVGVNLRKLDVRWPWLAAALFAVHPVHVESVAWMTESKNLLSALFCLLALWSYQAWAPLDGNRPESPRKRHYVASVVLFAASLLSKPATITLPFVILLLAWWKTGTIQRRRVVEMTPMLALGVGSGIITMHAETGASGEGFPHGVAERLLIAGRAFWFYLGKLLWPHPLIFFYPRWQLDPKSPMQVATVALTLLLFATLWALRHRIGRGALTGFLFFAGTLVPALGFFNVYYFLFSYVADHFLYVASLGPLALFAAGLVRLRDGGPKLRDVAFAVSIVTVLTLGALTYRRAGAFQSREILALDTLAKDPQNGMANSDLGAIMTRRGDLDGALLHLERALPMLIPRMRANVFNDIGRVLTDLGRPREGAVYLRQAIAVQPWHLTAHLNLGRALTRLGDDAGAEREFRWALGLNASSLQANARLAELLERRGNCSPAIGYYRAALAIDADDTGSLAGLGRCLLQQGNATEGCPLILRAERAGGANAALGEIAERCK
jgi:tetratricopeptide (TPR) repeat protein